MTVEELAEKLREAHGNAPRGRKSLALYLFGMKYADELGSASVLGDVCKLAGLTKGRRRGIERGMHLVQDGYATLNEDALWF